jgi:hypothetical protein
MALSGPGDGAPLLAPGAPASCAASVLDAIRRVSPVALAPDLEGPALLGERAAIAGLARRGAISPGGSARLLRAADGWLAVSLPRADDLALLPAWLGEGDAGDAWALVEKRIACRSAAEVVARARLLGLAVAPVSEAGHGRPWLREGVYGRAGPSRPLGDLLVADLSSLWAGPLCGHLLSVCGARVIKLESTWRPDGARVGPAAFFDLLNAGKESVALDFTTKRGRAQLHALLRRADIVIESSRPRALAQLGIDAAALVAEVRGLSWVSITGYGREEPGAHWVAFGDDAAAAGGLVIELEGQVPFFCGDAIADPLSGLHAALAVLEAQASGGGRLLDVSMCAVAAHARGLSVPDSEVRVVERDGGWEVEVDGRRQRVLPPRARRVRGRARPLGADTAAVLAELGAEC